VGIFVGNDRQNHNRGKGFFFFFFFFFFVFFFFFFFFFFGSYSSFDKELRNLVVGKFLVKWLLLVVVVKKELLNLLCEPEKLLVSGDT